MRSSAYVYMLSKTQQDFISTSFTSEDGHIEIFNFPEELKDFLQEFEYIICDYIVGNGQMIRYKNSEYIEFFTITNLELDSDRCILKVSIDRCEPFDLLMYKRDTKIRQIFD